MATHSTDFPNPGSSESQYTEVLAEAMDSDKLTLERVKLPLYKEKEWPSRPSNYVRL